MRGRAPSYRQQAFRKAAREVSRIPDDELLALAAADRLTDIPGVGEKTALVIAEALRGETPEYLTKLLNDMPEPGTDEGEALRTLLRGDLHSHSDWSDGGDTIEAMATKARELGHACTVPTHPGAGPGRSYTAPVPGGLTEWPKVLAC